MAKNKLTDLNDHLFCQLERLNDEDLTEDQIQSEVSRAKAISNIASQVIKSAKITLDATKMMMNGDIRKTELPKILGMQEDQGAG